MPVKCVGSRSGYCQYGESGKKYPYSNEAERRKAKQRAYIQGYAIQKNQQVAGKEVEKLEGLYVSIAKLMEDGVKGNYDNVMGAVTAPNYRIRDFVSLLRTAGTDTNKAQKVLQRYLSNGVTGRFEFKGEGYNIVLSGNGVTARIPFDTEIAELEIGSRWQPDPNSTNVRTWGELRDFSAQLSSWASKVRAGMSIDPPTPQEEACEECGGGGSEIGLSEYLQSSMEEYGEKERRVKLAPNMYLFCSVYPRSKICAAKVRLTATTMQPAVLLRGARALEDRLAKLDRVAAANGYRLVRSKEDIAPPPED